MSASRAKAKASSGSSKKPKTGKATALGVPSEDTIRGGSSRLCAFAQDGSRFLHVVRAGASERVRVFDALSGRVQSEAILDGSSRATCVKWLDLDLEGLPATASTDASEDVGRKKRRKRKTNDVEDAMKTDDVPPQTSGKANLVGVGRADGSVALFSPSHGRIVRTLTHPQSSSSITTMCTASDEGLPRLWNAAEDGKLRLWDARQNVLLGEWTTSESAPFTALAYAPSSSSEPCLLAGHHGIRLLSLPSSLSKPDISQGTTPLTGTLPITASLPGHATPISQLHYVSTLTSTTPTIASSAQDDRVISIWSLSSSALNASISLTGPVRSFSPSADGTHILAISTSDTLTVHALPTSSESSGKKVPLLVANASFALQPQKGSTRVEFADAVFLPDSPGSLRIARLVGGLKPIFDIMPYIDPQTGTYTLRTVLKSSPGDTDALLPVSAESTMGSTVQRYTEPQRVAVLSGETDLADGGDSDHEIGQADGLLDTDLAELSLGQRLQATQGHIPRSSSSSEESSPEDEPGTSRRRRKSKSKTKPDATTAQAAPPPASTLTRTLIQALHSSDAGLLEQCLSHSSPSLITASVARLPSQLALPLIDACVLRLARGARGSSGKGGGGGASAQRATVLVAWIRAVLGAHGGYLMSMPEAVARLAGLHGVMADRAKLRDGLEGLRGRLEMVEVQMAMRGRKEEKKREEVKVTRYVEGESSDEENVGEDVEVEVGSEGSVEDVELGASEDSDEGSESEFGGVGDSEDEDGSGSDDAGPKVNGFIDDEAEEWSEESGESDDE